MLLKNGTYLNDTPGRWRGGTATPISSGNYGKTGAMRGIAFPERATAGLPLIAAPTDEEAEELAAEQANAQPDPNTQYLQAAAKEAEAKSNQAQAQTVKTIADTEMAKAKTLETLSSISIAEQQSAFDAAAKIGVMMNSGNPAAVNAEQP
jgi:hypothetical protein